MKTALKQTMQVGRATVFCVGLAVVLAAILGVTTTALAAVPGDPLKLGQVNIMQRLTTLVGNVDSAMLEVDNNNAGASATALDLQVQPGKPPMKVNSGARVTNLHADRLDGKSAGEIGVNGQQIVRVASAVNADSPKTANASCPEGKVLVGTGNELAGATSGVPPNQETDVVIEDVTPTATAVFVKGVEEVPTNTAWTVVAIAICADAP